MEQLARILWVGAVAGLLVSCQSQRAVSSQAATVGPAGGDKVGAVYGQSRTWSYPNPSDYVEVPGPERKVKAVKLPVTLLGQPMTRVAEAMGSGEGQSSSSTR